MYIYIYIYIYIAYIFHSGSGTPSCDRQNRRTFCTRRLLLRRVELRRHLLGTVSLQWEQLVVSSRWQLEVVGTRLVSSGTIKETAQLVRPLVETFITVFVRPFVAVARALKWCFCGWLSIKIPIFYAPVACVFLIGQAGMAVVVAFRAMEKHSHRAYGCICVGGVISSIGK